MVMLCFCALALCLSLMIGQQWYRGYICNCQECPFDHDRKDSRLWFWLFLLGESLVALITLVMGMCTY